MNPIKIGVACEHCGWPHYYQPNQISIQNDQIRYRCRTSGLVGHEPNEPDVIEWLTSNGVPSALFAVPPSAEVPDRRPEPAAQVRGILATLAPILTAAVYVIAVAAGVIPRVLIMVLAVPVAVWFAWSIAYRGQP